MAGSRYSRRGLYRSRDGEIFGVCKGIAQWRDLPVGPIRLAVILLAVFTGFAPVIIIYLLAALVLPPEPKGSRFTNWDASFRRGFEHSSKYSTQHDKEQDWEERFRKYS